ncbi:hypothetical protein KEM56_001648, partial [Ascosphaera pollenicola]
LFHLEKAFQSLFCLPGSPMTKTNDFTDRASYLLQLAIPEAISRVRDSEGKTPLSVKRFLYDKLKFNDNSNNELSDCFYIATLLRSLGRALLGRAPPRPDHPDDDLGFDMEAELERQQEEQLDKDCMAEIDRYRRMDEWTSSFQNIYTRTAIRCQRDFMKANITEYDPIQFLQYTRAGTFEILRVEAFDILADFNIFSARELLTWFIYTMSSDVSPWIRRRLHETFGRNLAAIAFGDESTHATTPQEEEGGLIIQTEPSAEDRQQQLARRQTIPGALTALKHELEGPSSSVLKDALWAACNSPTVTLAELQDLVVGKLRFYRSDRPRTKIIPKWVPRPAVDNSNNNNNPHTMFSNGNNLKRRREDSLSGGSPYTTSGSNKVTLKLPKLAPPSPFAATPASNANAAPPQSRTGSLPKLKLKLKSFNNSL